MLLFNLLVFNDFVSSVLISFSFEFDLFFFLGLFNFIFCLLFIERDVLLTDLLVFVDFLNFVFERFPFL
jgi:hypothetical protein